MNYKKYNTVGTVSKSNRKLIEIKEKISTPNTYTVPGHIKVPKMADDF